MESDQLIGEIGAAVRRLGLCLAYAYAESSWLLRELGLLYRRGSFCRNDGLICFDIRSSHANDSPPCQICNDQADRFDESPRIRKCGLCV